MIGDTKKLLLAGIFTIVLIVTISFAWYVNYGKSEDLLQRQLSRRLISLAAIASTEITPDLVSGLLLGDFEDISEVMKTLEAIRHADSLNEVFVLSDQLYYLASTSPEPDSVYFLADLNAPYLDSIIFGLTDQAISSATYRSGDIYLKSAFAPLVDSEGLVVALIGVEASVDYFADMESLKNNMLLAIGMTLIAGVILLFLFLLLQSRFNKVQHHLFLNETHSYLGRMVAVVSHEIKNPLMIIRASAERLGKKMGDKDSQEVAFITEEVDRLNEIVSGYLTFSSSVTSGTTSTTPQLTTNTEVFDLAELVMSLKQNLNEKFPNDSICWVSEMVAHPTIVKLHRRPLRQVLLNLVINGVEACRESGREIQVGIEVDLQPEYVVITVLDRGKGFTKSEAKRAFEPFYSTRKSGSGLGLYLSKSIVAQMGGELNVHSCEGEGTQMVIILPREPIE